MPDRILVAVHAFLDVLFTLITALALIGIAEVFSIVAACLAIPYWIVRIKRDVDKYHNGKFFEYIKYIFKKHKRSK